MGTGLGAGKRQKSADTLQGKARMLQRILDCSAKHDNYCLRQLAGRPNPAADEADLQRAKRSLEKLLHGDSYGDDVAAFLAFAKKYYDESRAGKSGEWHCHAETVLRRCAQNPPHVRHVRNVHIARALNCSQEKAAAFKEWVKNKETKAGKSRLWNICKEARRLQRKHGNEMKMLRDSEKEVRDIYAKSEKAAAVIGKFLEQGEIAQSKYASPFVLAQLFQHIDGGAGFSSTCHVCSYDNAWRAVMTSGASGEYAARGKSLPTDSVRPFDGMLRRILEAQAQAIAKLQAEKLMKESYDGRDIAVEICVEQNAFAFAKSLADIKPKKEGGNKAKSKHERGLEKIWEAGGGKKERICQNEHCPYTGKKIITYEIDHIISRAECRRNRGVSAFDSEANLIGCSRTGNQNKGANIYLLDMLHGNYLREVFGSNDVEMITQRIREKVSPLLADSRRYTSFAELHKEDFDAAVCLRHGLFVADLREKIIRSILSTERMARVNGTQRFLAKKIWEFLSHRLGVTFDQKGENNKGENKNRVRRKLVRADAVDVHAARMLLPSEWHKDDDIQGAASHVADAAIVRLLCAADFSDDNSADKDLEIADFSADVFDEMMPKEVQVIHLERRAPWQDGRKDKAARYKIFGDTIYGERFLPLIVTADGTLLAGFALDNGATIGADVADKWLCALSPFLHLRFAKKSLANLQQLAKEDSRGYIDMSINKQRAMQYMLDCWQAQKDDDDAAKFLRTLHYITVRKDVRDVVLDNRKKMVRPQEAILKDAAFMISVDMQLLGGKGTEKICLPSKKDWEKILESPDLYNVLGSKLKDVENIDEIIRKATENVCKSKHSNNRAHYRRRVVRSLQVLSKPSGAWRIRRRTPNGHVFQLLSVDNFSYRGFNRSDDGQADFNHLAPLAEMLNSKYAAPLRPAKKARAVVSFDEWREVVSPDNSPMTKMRVATGTKYARAEAEIPLDTLLRIAEIADGQGDAWHKIPAEFYIKDSAKSAAIFGVLFSVAGKKGGAKTIAIPRVQILSISDKKSLIRFRAAEYLRTDLHNRFNAAS